ncbi:serum opacification factor [Streptococcus pyogenes]|uniref:serum opacification factor n=1 Tax=Streptococcus pyogenes TaxID=1314 RepID=UPI00109CFDDB|nr:serum opacification factor [Streptococcus pyogenes]VGV38631.1 serum opacity factor [Streptococcus pyogenes]VHC56413.1 serum opacity factor [Streptococcus pyogenes]VHD10381.1 serum opacity factor [Streptococcus pyogenes]VHD39771.1 serum opacity factor [Streptococcus pyogenes]VHD45658.1 serum opacity factor [Streptococcus pyogenes]
MTNCKYKLRKLSVGLVSVGTMLIAPTVLGQEVSASTTSTETSASTNTNTAGADATASGTTATTPSASTSTGGVAGSGTSDASVASSGGTQSTTATSETTPKAQAQTAVATSSSSSNANASSSETQASKAASTASASSTPAAASSNSNQVTGAEAAPQMMDVEQYKVDKEEAELKVKDGKNPKNGSQVDKDTKLIRNRDDEQRDIVDIKREVKTNADGTIDVTVTVTPKEIDKGADAMALLDVSQKMTDADFKNAKDKIKKLVKTLTSKSASNSNNDEHKHNSRNSVRLMTFYREISNPIDISGKTDAELDTILDGLREKAKANYDWGVDLQGAIHKAREIFNKEKEKKSGKRQHIVLFSQGESTFSYELQNSVKEDKSKLSRLTETVTSSNPLLPWPPIFNHTHKNIDMLDDVKHLVKLGQALGIKGLDNLQSTLKLVSAGSNVAGLFLGGGSLTEYLTLKEYKSGNLTEKQFDYTKRVGEGYHFHSFSDRKVTGEIPFKSDIESQIKGLFKSSNTGDKSWFESILDKLSLTERVQEAKQKALMKLLGYLFYKREYHYYNHNLSAIAEAKMAQQEGITFYSVDVTDLNSASKRAKREGKSEEAKKKEKENKDIEQKRNEKFDNYLKQMSEDGKNFFKDVDQAEKFKDTLTNVTVTETFEDGVNVKEKSCQTSLDSNNNSSKSNGGGTFEYKKSSSSSWLSLLSSTKESLTWTISKDQLKEAFEKNGFLTFKYKLQVNKDKLLDKGKKRAKRSTSTENENSVTDKIISNTVTYKINGQEVKGNKLDDVKLTYTKETVPVPDVEGTVEVPQAPEKPLVDPILPPQPSLPNIPTPQLPKDEDLEISGGHGPIVDIVEDTGTGVEGGAQNGVVSTQENKDPIVDITEDTQPGMSGSNDATVVEEDTAPKRPDVLVGGQSDPIDITEDTQPSVSGSNDATVVEEDTVPQRPDILVGGQSDPIDITEDTQPGMSGANDATVIEEDTKPKRFFHFDNEPQAPEKPKEQPSLSLPQAPVYKAAHHLPASGDKREASFTIAALTIIGAAGLLSKKRRDTEEN